MRSEVRSSFLLPGIKEAELKFILFVVCQPVCLFLWSLLHLPPFECIGAPCVEPGPLS